uniref:Uncharacterized protein n=1 Tax=Nelumbo nucifera TaxID=4432 RepID=A0A822XHX9_NELNU|nr:TPA_asm: hypothetical protein HUJ06_022567 [Nelumbo nucifera]
MLHSTLQQWSRAKEYLPITGLADFNKLSAKLIFGADRYKFNILEVRSKLLRDSA